MTKIDFAIKRFNEGFRCSQAIFEAYAPDFDIDPIMARKIATPLAGGSGLGGECGAVSGAFLVMGLKYGVKDAGDLDGFWTIMEKVRNFSEKFKAIHGDLNCRQLIGVDVFSEDGFQEFQEKKLHETHCTKYVQDAMKLLEDAMA